MSGPDGLRRICVYCGASPGARPVYREAAEAVGALLAAQGIGLVYGGGDVGLMGAVADATLAAGGEVIGVIPEALAAKEVAHAGLTELHVVGSMHERKMLMADLADGFIAMPGGIGTVEEVVEVLTWLQLGLHDKPVALLDVAGYWAPLVAFLDHSVGERFIRPEHRGMLLVSDDARELLAAFDGWAPPRTPKWIDRDEA